MRILFSRVQFEGVTREEVEADQTTAKAENRPVNFPRTILVENAIGYNEAYNGVIANLGYDIRQADRSTIAAYEVNQRTGATMFVQSPYADAVIYMD